MQNEVVCTEEVIARLISPDTPACAKRAVLYMLRDIAQGSTSRHLFGPVPSHALDTWDVRVYVAESDDWCVLWELAVGFSERKLWSSGMYQAGLEGDNYDTRDVPATLIARVWSIGSAAEVKGALGVAAVERLRKSHLRGSQSKVHGSRLCAALSLTYISSPIYRLFYASLTNVRNLTTRSFPCT